MWMDKHDKFYRKDFHGQIYINLYLTEYFLILFYFFIFLLKQLHIHIERVLPVAVNIWKVCSIRNKV